MIKEAVEGLKNYFLFKDLMDELQETDRQFDRVHYGSEFMGKKPGLLEIAFLNGIPTVITTATTLSLAHLIVYENPVYVLAAVGFEASRGLVRKLVEMVCPNSEDSRVSSNERELSEGEAWIRNYDMRCDRELRMNDPRRYLE